MTDFSGYSCWIGRQLIWPDSSKPDGLDWVNPCPHPVTDAVMLVDVNEWLMLCFCHHAAMNAEMDFQDSPEAAIDQLVEQQNRLRSS